MGEGRGGEGRTGGYHQKGNTNNECLLTQHRQEGLGVCMHEISQPHAGDVCILLIDTVLHNKADSQYATRTCNAMRHYCRNVIFGRIAACRGE